VQRKLSHGWIENAHDKANKEMRVDNTWRNERQVAREQVIAALQAGQSWQAVSQKPDVPLKRAMAYRLLRAVRERGNSALQDDRHGHPIKLRGEVRTFLEAYCRQAPHTPSFTVQGVLQERFALTVSVSQINRVRAALGVSNHSPKSAQEKNDRIRSYFATPRVARRCREFAVACCCL